VSRRADPERIYQANRIAIRNGLTDYGVSLELAERWCDAWEAEAASRNIERLTRDYWTFGSAWIREQRQARREPRAD
jgi:hypothetical protein